MAIPKHCWKKHPRRIISINKRNVDSPLPLAHHAIECDFCWKKKRMLRCVWWRPGCLFWETIRLPHRHRNRIRHVTCSVTPPSCSWTPHKKVVILSLTTPTWGSQSTSSVPRKQPAAHLSIKARIHPQIPRENRLIHWEREKKRKWERKDGRTDVLQSPCTGWEKKKCIIVHDDRNEHA